MSRRGLFVALYLAAQLLLPLQYYLQRQDRHDERFAWRMFSPERTVRCRVAFRVGDEPVPRDGTFHQAWWELASRGRIVVVERMASRLCQEGGGRPVGVLLVCIDVGEEPRPLIDTVDACTEPSR